MKEFDIANVKPEWMDVVQEFPEIFLIPSKYVLESWEKYHEVSDYIPKNKEDLVNLRFGFECRVGWKEILRGHLKKIQVLINDHAKENGKDACYKGCILKEKFGSLRDQGDIDGEDKKEYWPIYSRLCDEIYRKSIRTCEVTGTVGVTCKNAGGWVKTLSESEYSKDDRFSPCDDEP